MASNLPPGVSNADIESQAAWDAVYETVDNDSARARLSDQDARAAWKMGVAAFLAARAKGMRFPHDGPEVR